MKNSTKMIILILAGVFIAGLFLQGQLDGITGQTVRCSKAPEVINFYVSGDRISMDWTDSSTFGGQVKYEVLLFKKGDDGQYDFSKPLKSTWTDRPYHSFISVKDDGSYVFKVRARNDPTCVVEYSDYTTSNELVKLTYAPLAQ